MVIANNFWLPPESYVMSMNILIQIIMKLSTHFFPFFFASSLQHTAEGFYWFYPNVSLDVPIQNISAIVERL